MNGIQFKTGRPYMRHANTERNEKDMNAFLA